MNYQTKHKGWFYFCPVYVYDADSEGPWLEPRHWSLDPAMWLAHHFGGFCIFVASLFGHEPMWCIKVGRLLEGKRE